jgi:phosphate transport system permease protein
VAASFAILVLLTFVLMALELMLSAWPAIAEFGFTFVVGTQWDPYRRVFGALPFIYGTLVTSLIAVCVAVPVSLGTAIFLTEFAPQPLRVPVGFLVELLAAVPSVVYGLWGIFVLVPWLRNVAEPALARSMGFLPFFSGPHQGFGLLAGGLILAIMITPTITSVGREVIQAVPDSLREGALALGATRWEAVRAVVLPHAHSGLLGAVILGLGRALGETMAITMVIGNRPTDMSLGSDPSFDPSLFSPGASMASVIANEFTEATDDLHLAALAYVGLLLFAVTIMLNIVARVLVWRASDVGDPRRELE